MAESSPASTTTSLRPRRNTASGDLLSGLGRWRLCLTMSWSDTLLPLRRSYLGPFWITLQLAMWVFLVVLIFRPGLGAGTEHYALYAALGISAFQLITVAAVDGVSAFLKEAGLIQNIPNPYSIYVYRLFFKMLIAFVFAAPIIAIAMWIDGFTPSAVGIAVSAAGVLITAVCWTGAALALACGACFIKDLVQLNQALVRILFFATPLFWSVQGASGARAALVSFNPVYYFIEIVRAPIHAQIPDPAIYAVCFALGAGFWATGILLFLAIRPRLAGLL